MFNLLQRILTKSLTNIPLFWVNFNKKHYIEKGKYNSCTAYIHPLLKNDEYINDTLKELVSYIKDNYDMEDV